MAVEEIEYRGICKNKVTNEYEQLFVTSISELLCKNRTIEKANESNRWNSDKYQYDIDTVMVQKRSTIKYTSKWVNEEKKKCYIKEELEDRLVPVAIKMDKNDCSVDGDVVRVTLPWLDNANDCLEVYIVRHLDGTLSMEFD